MSRSFLQPLVGVLGFPVAENPTQVMIEAAFAKMGLDWRYLTLEVAPDRLPAAVEGLRACGFKGFNCTIPHKVAVIPLLDGLSPAAEKIGAVNCVVNRDGKFLGDNTDGKGSRGPARFGNARRDPRRGGSGAGDRRRTRARRSKRDHDCQPRPKPRPNPRDLDCRTYRSGLSVRSLGRKVCHPLGNRHSRECHFDRALPRYPRRGSHRFGNIKARCSGLRRHPQPAANAPDRRRRASRVRGSRRIGNAC